MVGGASRWRVEQTGSGWCKQVVGGANGCWVEQMGDGWNQTGGGRGKRMVGGADGSMLKLLLRVQTPACLLDLLKLCSRLLWSAPPGRWCRCFQMFPSACGEHAGSVGLCWRSAWPPASSFFSSLSHSYLPPGYRLTLLLWSLSSVVYEHRSRLEKSLQKERLDHKKAKEGEEPHGRPLLVCKAALTNLSAALSF